MVLFKLTGKCYSGLDADDVLLYVFLQYGMLDVLGPRQCNVAESAATNSCTLCMGTTFLLPANISSKLTDIYLKLATLPGFARVHFNCEELP